MTDMGHRQCDQRGVARDIGRALCLDVANQRPDLDRSVLVAYAVEAGNAVDVDQQCRPVEPHVEGCNQALPAGKQSCLLVRQ